MLFRLLKAILLAATALVVVAALAAFLWVERQARVLAHDATAPWGSALHWQSTGVSLTPPGVALSSVRLDGADGKPLFRAARCVLPLAPGAVTGHGPKTSTPRCEDWQATLAPGGRWPALADVDATNGRLTLAVGDARWTLDAATLSLHGGALALGGRVDKRPGTFHLDGTISDAGLDATIAFGPLDAAPLSSWILAPAEGRVLGGALGLDGELVARAGRLSLTGTLAADDLMVEGTGVSSLEKAIRLRGSSAHLPIALSAPLEGADWPAAVRRSLGG